MALAAPTRLGQRMTVLKKEATNLQLRWLSYNVESTCWFEAYFSLPDLDVIQTTDPAISKRLKSIFQAITNQRPAFWASQPSLQIATYLEFPRLWGLGTSSTLLVNLARWSQTDPYALLRDSFTGSGYDIACGLAQGPILYQMKETERPQFVQIPYYPTFTNQLYFVYLETKQDSRAGIARYKQMVSHPDEWVDRISALTMAMVQARDLIDFEQCILSHEQIVAQALQLPRAQEYLFPDYWGQIKSLGAWGGDFILATSHKSVQETQRYFKQKGYSVVLSYDELL